MFFQTWPLSVDPFLRIHGVNSKISRAKATSWFEDNFIDAREAPEVLQTNIKKICKHFKT